MEAQAVCQSQACRRFQQSLYFQQLENISEKRDGAGDPAVRDMARNREYFDAICLSHIDLGSGCDHEPT